MLTVVNINGEWYHAQYADYDDEKGEWTNPEPILGEYDDKPIPTTVCICFAKHPSDCICACYRWGNYSDYNDEYGY